jgi:5,10-methylenetetrahydromethanopterin reductase
MPTSVHEDRDVALRAAKRAVGELLPRFWALGQKLEQAKQALLTGTAIREDEFARLAERLRAGEDPVEVLDERCALAFSIAGTPDECIQQARPYRTAGVTELAMTFNGADVVEQIAQIGEAMRGAR